MAREPVKPPDPARPGAAAAGAAAIRAATSGAFREAVAFERPAAAEAGGVAVPLSDYLSLLRREIARAGVETAPEGDAPLVSFAEAEISLAVVALAIENDRLIVDPSWKALSEAPEAAVQRLKLRLVDGDMIAAGRAKP